MKQVDEFIIEQEDGIEMLTTLTPELLEAFKKTTGENYTKIELLGTYQGIKKEFDGRAYPMLVLRLLAYSGYGRYYGTYFNVKMSPFDCYFGEFNIYKIRNTTNLIDENLSSRYRQLLEEKFGRDWKINYYSYIKRVELYKKQLEEEIKELEANNTKDTIIF